MQFQVPQFIDTEDKIVGPLSIKQFAYAAGIAALLAVLFPLLEFWLWMIFFTIFGGFAAVLIFGRFNGRPITVLFRALFESIWAPSVYKYYSGKEIEGQKKAVSPITITATKSPIKPQPQIQETAISEPPIAKPGISKAAKPDFGGIKNLMNRINTSKTAIPQREKPLQSQTDPFAFPKERYQEVTHITGEREVAKRVDYRK